MANPLDGDWIGGRPGLTVDDLQAYCDRLNAMGWLKTAGFMYYVNGRRDEDGTLRRFVDRREHRPDAMPYRPSDAEAAATHRVIAKLIRENVERHEFNRLQQDGSLNRMIERDMAMVPA